MAYEKDKDYQALINEAVAGGDYKSAAGYEQQRNEKIAGEGIADFAPTSKYSGWMDDTDYSAILKDQMASGASADDVADTLGKRVDKASGTEGLSQYANDDVYTAAMDYILNNNKASQEFKYEEAPEWSSKYSAQIDELTQALLGREDFSYNKDTDPLYTQYKDSYTREGNRAMQDTIGQVAARTGGLASSYATTAGTQANDYYMSQLADKVPELQQLAYSMFNDDGDRQLQNIQLLMALEEGDYEKYADLLAQYNTDRNFDYGVYSDDKAYDYQTGRDDVEDGRYDTEWQYQTGQDSKNDAQERIGDYLAAGGNVADLDPTLISSSGYTQAELTALANYAAQKAAGASKGSSGGGRSGGGRGGSGGVSGGGGLESLYEDMKSSGMPEAYLAAYYKKYGIAYSQLSSVLSGFNTWSDGGGASGDGEDYKVTNRHGDSWIYIPGHGRFSYQEVYNYVESGKVIETLDPSTGTVSYKWHTNKKE
ncbi:MAG: hypothetical protein RR365_04040 [Bacteroides sp.]